MTGYLNRLGPALAPVPLAGRCLHRRDSALLCLSCCAEASGDEREWGPLSEAERERCHGPLDRRDLRLKARGEP